MKKLKKSTKVDFATYLGVTLAFIVLTVLKNNGMLTRSLTGQLVPICCYIVIAVSLNLTVGILGELSLGHAGFMSIGAFSGVITAMSLQSAVPSAAVRLGPALVAGAGVVAPSAYRFMGGMPVLRLRGDYLAIVTLAAGEIIKELINCLIVGRDENGLHIIFNASGAKSVNDLGLSETGKVIIKGAQGATGTQAIASFTAGSSSCSTSSTAAPDVPSWRCATTASPRSPSA